MSLYVKFIWFTFATMLVSSLIAFLAMNTYYHQVLKAQNNEKNMAIAQSFATFVDEVTPAHAKATLRLLGEAGYQLYMTDGDSVLRYGGKYRDEAIDNAVIQQVLDGKPYNGMRDFPPALFVTGFFANELRNTVGVPIEIDGKRYALFSRPNIELLFKELHLLFGGLAIGIILLSFLGMLLVARLLIQPITKLTKATEMMGTETFDVPLSIQRKDEIGRLADQFLTMREQIKRSILKQKEFVHNVSHDIQSPLHTIKSYLMMLEKDGLSEDERKQYFNIIQEESTRMSLLTTQLLTLSSFNSETIDPVEEVQVDRQVHDVLSRLRYAFEEKELGISAQLESIKVKGNAVLLQTVWENIVTNAIKYSNPGGLIEVRMTLSPEYMTLIIQDEGVGMSPNDVERAFERFYRADQARTRLLKGSGLGLSIVKEIIDLHKGMVEIRSTLNVGTTVQIKLPLL